MSWFPGWNETAKPLTNATLAYNRVKRVFPISKKLAEAEDPLLDLDEELKFQKCICATLEKCNSLACRSTQVEAMLYNPVSVYIVYRTAFSRTIYENFDPLHLTLRTVEGIYVFKDGATLKPVDEVLFKEERRDVTQPNCSWEPAMPEEIKDEIKLLSYLESLLRHYGPLRAGCRQLQGLMLAIPPPLRKHVEQEYGSLEKALLTTDVIGIADGKLYLKAEHLKPLAKEEDRYKLKHRKWVNVVDEPSLVKAHDAAQTLLKQVNLMNAKLDENLYIKRHLEKRAKTKRTLAPSGSASGTGNAGPAVVPEARASPETAISPTSSVAHTTARSSQRIPDSATPIVHGILKKRTVVETNSKSVSASPDRPLQCPGLRATECQHVVRVQANTDGASTSSNTGISIDGLSIRPPEYSPRVVMNSAQPSCNVEPPQRANTDSASTSSNACESIDGLSIRPPEFSPRGVTHSAALPSCDTESRVMCNDEAAGDVTSCGRRYSGERVLPGYAAHAAMSRRSGGFGRGRLRKDPPQSPPGHPSSDLPPGLNAQPPCSDPWMELHEKERKLMEQRHAAEVALLEVRRKKWEMEHKTS